MLKEIVEATDDFSKAMKKVKLALLALEKTTTNEKILNKIYDLTDNLSDIGRMKRN